MPQRFTAGQKFTGLSATTWNEFCDTTDIVNRRTRQSSRSGLILPDTTVALVKNMTEADRSRGEVLGIDLTPLIDTSGSPTEDEVNESWSRIALQGVTPDYFVHRRRFCILLEDLPDGEIGPACIAGACYARVSGSGVGYAEIDDGLYVLKTYRDGMAQILTSSFTTDDNKLSVIRIIDRPEEEWVKLAVPMHRNTVSEDAIIQIPDPSSGYHDDPDGHTLDIGTSTGWSMGYHFAGDIIRVRNDPELGWQPISPGHVHCVCTLGGSLASGGGATATRLKYSGGWVSAGDTISVMDGIGLSATIPSGTRLLATWNDTAAAWIATGAPC